MRSHEKLFNLTLAVENKDESIQSLVTKKFKEDRRYDSSSKGYKYECFNCKHIDHDDATVVWQEPISVPPIIVIQLQRKNQLYIQISDDLKIRKMKTFTIEEETIDFTQA